LRVYYHPKMIPSNATPFSDTTEEAGIEQISDSEVTVLARRLIFENTVFSVYADHISDKKRNEVPRYLSVVPKCLLADSVAGVAVLPVREGKLGLIRVFRHPLGRWSWEAIKGHVESGENAQLAAVRELVEESGFLVGINSFLDLGSIAPEGGVIEARTRLFVGVVAEEVQSDVNPELGHGELAFFANDDVDDLIERCEIEDASTLVLILKYQRLLESRVPRNNPMAELTKFSTSQGKSGVDVTVEESSK
jgi:ADP-ribose pyrophosphatase